MLNLIYIVGTLGTVVLSAMLVYRLVIFLLTLFFGNVYRIKRVDSSGHVYIDRKRITSDEELEKWLLDGDQ